MIDFATLQGLTIPEGVVTQIADAAGRVLWSAWSTSGNVILEVEKITSNTYAGNTTYENEEFILLDVYPKSGGTVNVTYGGLTKTITDDGTSEEPNAQQVFFGTFNGVSDSVATPASGKLTIEGGYAAFGIGGYKKAKIAGNSHFIGITEVKDWGLVEYIPNYAFGSMLTDSCDKMTIAKIPSSVTSIGNSAFYGCTSLTNITIPNSVTSIGNSAFASCTSLTGITIPNSVTSIGGSAFDFCHSLTSITIPNSVTSIGDRAFNYCTSLTGITIPASVTSIGANPWPYCTSLEYLVVDASNENYMVENGTLFNKGKTELIGYYPTLSGSCTIPTSVTSIGGYAFYGCASLTNVTIPNSVTSIGDMAFYLTSGNRTVTMLSDTPPELSSTTVFDDVGTNNIVVPAGSGATYKAAEYWSEYADYITEAS